MVICCSSHRKLIEHVIGNWISVTKCNRSSTCDLLPFLSFIKHLDVVLQKGTELQVFCQWKMLLFLHIISLFPCLCRGFPGGATGKEPSCQCRRYKKCRFNPWVGKILPGEGDGNPLQYSCLENPIDGGAWRTIVHGLAESQTGLKQLSTQCRHEVETACTVSSSAFLHFQGLN